MARERKVYTAEFKRQAIQMMTEQKLSVAEAARKLGVSENCLRRWQAALAEQGADAFPGPGQVSPADEQLRQLRAELQKLKAERDLLKKAAAYFASQSQ